MHPADAYAGAVLVAILVAMLVVLLWRGRYQAAAALVGILVMLTIFAFMVFKRTVPSGLGGGGRGGSGGGDGDGDGE